MTESHKKQDTGDKKAKEIGDRLSKVITDLATVTVEIFETDPFTIGNAIVDYFNAVDPNPDDEWVIGDIKFNQEGVEP